MSIEAQAWAVSASCPPYGEVVPLKVLVAEDVALNRELVKLFLQPRGHHVDTVDDGDHAVRATLNGDYDVVVMDMQMPTVDGLQATRSIREAGGRFATLPILGLSANVVPDQVERCIQAGMNSHLCKPFTSESLASAVENLGARAVRSVWSGNVRVDRHQNRILLELLNRQIETFERTEHAVAASTARLAHGLRGGAAIMGYWDLANVCRTLEDACGGSDWRPALVAALRTARLVRRDIRAEALRDRA